MAPHETSFFPSFPLLKNDQLQEKRENTLLEQKVAGTKSREDTQCFEKKLELKVAGTKSCGTKSRAWN